MIKASVIIPNWNGKELLKDCLASLTKQTFRNFEIILVDNASSDDSLSYVKENFPKIKIITLAKNFGFARAINEGVKLSNAKYCIFLNNDASADKNWLKNMIECADLHSEVISVNPKILNFFNRKLIDGVGISINEVGQAGSIGWNEVDSGQYNREEYIFGATGAASLFKRADFVKVGGFDESFFMYSEEVDFAFRAQFLRFKSIFCPNAKVFHKHKATAQKYPQLVEYWQFRNMYQTIIKDFPANIILKKWRWLKIILVYGNTVIYQIKKGFFWPPVLVTLYLLFHLPALATRRVKIQRSKKVDDSYIESFLKPKEISIIHAKIGG